MTNLKWKMENEMLHYLCLIAHTPVPPPLSRRFSGFASFASFESLESLESLESFASTGLGCSVFGRRRLRVKVIDLAGTMSSAPSQESALALLFFAGGFPAGGA